MEASIKLPRGVMCRTVPDLLPLPRSGERLLVRDDDRLESLEADLVIARTDDPNSVGTKQIVARAIVRGLVGIVVDRTVELDDETKLGAEEIDDESLHDLLATEVVPADRVPPQ